MPDILVVDDEQEIADLVELYLKNEGYTLYKCYDGAQALEQIAARPFDLAILDVMLPEIDGIQLLRRMKADPALRDIPVIMATAKGAEYDKIQSLDLGADDYLVKPFEMKELMARINAVLRRSEIPDDTRKRLVYDKLVIDLDSYELIVDGKAVVGASGQCADGTTYRVMADRGVILATGGYSGNPDLLKKYNEMWPWDESTVIPTTNSYGHTGDGHVLAEGLGAELKNMGRQMVFPIADSIDYSTETIVGNAGLGLFVNVNGERFINESLDRFALSAAVMKQPEEKLFIISDALNSGLVNGYNEQGYSADKLIEESKLFRADSIEELAQMIGADPSVLAKAVDDYNAIARGDVADTVFGRENMSEKDAIVEAPFYASPRTWAAHVTIGGVSVGPDYQALTADGAGIEGLYVVGECSDGNSGVSSMSTGLSCVNQMLA